MQLTRPARALLLCGLDAPLKLSASTFWAVASAVAALPANARIRRSSSRAERRGRIEAIERHQQADTAAVEHERHEHGRLHAGGELAEPETHTARQIPEPFRVTGPENFRERGALDGEPAADDVRTLAGRRGHHKLVSFREQDEQQTGVHQRARPLHHQLEHTVDVRLAAGRAAIATVASSPVTARSSSPR